MEKSMSKTNQNKNYTVYHLHSDLSNGVTNVDSVTKYNEYIDYAASLGMKAMAFSEHGSIFQWVKKKVDIEKAGMKYIHAEEFYVTEDLYQEPKTEEYEKALTELTESLLGKDPEDAQQEIYEFIESNKVKVRDNLHCTSYNPQKSRVDVLLFLRILLFYCLCYSFIFFSAVNLFLLCSQSTFEGASQLIHP